MASDLLQPEQVEVVDDEGGGQRRPHRGTNDVQDARQVVASTSQTTPVIGRHCHINSASGPVASST